jgi:pyridoxamine 5'-phosphate oxidase
MKTNKTFSMFELSHMRKEYLPEKEAGKLHENPSEQFRIWFEEAVKAGIEEPNAMIISTVGKNFRPSSRIVLLKQFDGLGFIFFTNYESRKGKELELNPLLHFFFHG